MKHFLIILVIGISSTLVCCKKEIDKNYLIEAENVMKSNISLNDKYNKIFVNKLDNELDDNQITKLSNYFFKINLGWNKIEIRDGNKLFAHLNGAVINNTNLKFDNLELYVTTFAEFENKSFISDLIIYEIDNFNENNITKFDIRHKIDNLLNCSIGSEKVDYVQLDESYLKHRIKSYKILISVRATNNIGNDFQIPIIDENFSYMWNDYMHYEYNR